MSGLDAKADSQISEFIQSKFQKKEVDKSQIISPRQKKVYNKLEFSKRQLRILDNVYTIYKDLNSTIANNKSYPYSKEWDTIYNKLDQKNDIIPYKLLLDCMDIPLSSEEKIERLEKWNEYQYDQKYTNQKYTNQVNISTLMIPSVGGAALPAPNFLLYTLYQMYTSCVHKYVTPTYKDNQKHITSEYKDNQKHIGSVYFDPKYLFNDGATGKKLFIIIGYSPCLKFCLVVKTTSKQKFETPKNAVKCLKNGQYFFIQENHDFFKLNTWVDFTAHSFKPIKISDFLVKTMSKQIDKKGILTTNTLHAMKNCLEQSEDISGEYITWL